MPLRGAVGGATPDRADVAAPARRWRRQAGGRDEVRLALAAAALRLALAAAALRLAVAAATPEAHQQPVGGEAALEALEAQALRVVVPRGPIAQHEELAVKPKVAVCPTEHIRLDRRRPVLVAPARPQRVARHDHRRRLAPEPQEVRRRAAPIAGDVRPADARLTLPAGRATV